MLHHSDYDEKEDKGLFSQVGRLFLPQKCSNTFLFFIAIDEGVTQHYLSMTQVILAGL